MKTFAITYAVIMAVLSCAAVIATIITRAYQLLLLAGAFALLSVMIIKEYRNDKI